MAHETRRSTWPAARHLQQAADTLRGSGAQGASSEHIADLLDENANLGAWLAPYREGEGGYWAWRAATRLAHETLGEPDPDTCPVCHPPRH